MSAQQERVFFTYRSHCSPWIIHTSRESRSGV